MSCGGTPAKFAAIVESCGATRVRFAGTVGNSVVISGVVTGRKRAVTAASCGRMSASVVAMHVNCVSTSASAGGTASISDATVVGDPRCAGAATAR